MKKFNVFVVGVVIAAMALAGCTAADKVLAGMYGVEASAIALSLVSSLPPSVRVVLAEVAVVTPQAIAEYQGKDVLGTKITKITALYQTVILDASTLSPQDKASVSALVSVVEQLITTLMNLNPVPVPATLTARAPAAPVLTSKQVKQVDAILAKNAELKKNLGLK